MNKDETQSDVRIKIAYLKAIQEILE